MTLHGGQRPHKHKDPPFSFQGPRHEGFQNPCCLYDPYVCIPCMCSIQDTTGLSGPYTLALNFRLQLLQPDGFGRQLPDTSAGQGRCGFAALFLCLFWVVFLLFFLFLVFHFSGQFAGIVGFTVSFFFFMSGLLRYYHYDQNSMYFSRGH